MHDGTQQDGLAASGITPGGAPPPAAGAPAPFQYVKDDGTWNDGALEKLGYADNPTLSTIKGPAPLAKAYLELRGLMGKKFIRPGEGSTPEEVADWRKLVGSPDSAEAYGALMPEGFDKESWDPEVEKQFAALAHSEHLPPDTTKKIAAFHAAASKAAADKQLNDFRATLAAQEEGLKKEWGQDYARQDGHFKALAAYMGFPPDHDIFHLPGVKAAFAKFAPTFLGGDKLIKGETPSVTGGLLQQRDTIMDGPDYNGVNGKERQLAAAARVRAIGDALEKSKG